MRDDEALPPEASEASNAREVKTELREYLSFRDERRRLLPKAALVGLASGLVAVAFRSMLALGDAARNGLVAWSRTLPAVGWAVPVAFAAAGAGLSVTIVRKWAPETSGSGIPHLEATLRRRRTLRWSRVLVSKFVGGVLALGSGMALGREGPTVQMGGSVGAGIAGLLKAGAQERLTLIAAGAGAGLAAAFNAPLAGLVFVLEELQRDFRPNVFGAAFVAAAAADVVSRLFSGQLPAFAAPAYPAPALSLLPAFALLGILAGLLGVAFNRGLILSLNAFGKIHPGRKILAGTLVGALVGLVAFFMPESVGGGHGLAESALGAKLALGALPALFLLRFVMTLGSYGTGAPGGIFAPLLALGSLIGLGVGDLTALALPNAAVVPGAFAVVGMAAYFTAIVRAPLTGIVLIVEMTSSYALSLPLLVACFCAYCVAESLRNLPIYEELLQRDLASGKGAAAVHEEPVVIEIEVEPGSAFAGRRVRDLGLPAGALLVGCRDGHHEWVPDADTVLSAHTRVTAVVSHRSEGGLEALREGCAHHAGRR